MSPGECALLVRVQAGMMGNAFEAELRSRGYSMGHFPQSIDLSTVGGGASLRRGFGKASAQLAFLYAKAGAGAYGNGQSAIINPGLSLYQFSLLLGYRVLGTAEGAGLDLRAGPMLQKWGGDFTLTAPSRFGALGAIGVTAPLASGLDLEAEASLGVAGSPFAEPDFAELPADYEAKSTWTRALSLGLALRF